MNVTRILTALVAAGFVAGTAMAQTAAAPATTAPAAAKATPAQDDAFLSQGTILYGGTFGWSMNQWSGYGDHEKSSSFDLAPEVDYFIIDNLSIGLIADINWQRWKENGWTENETQLIGELVGRYYVPLCNNRIIPYVGATLGGGYGMYNEKWNGGGSYDEDSTLTTYGGQAGFLVPLNANVMLNTCVSYKRYQRQGGNYYYSENRDEGETMLTMGFLIKL